MTKNKAGTMISEVALSWQVREYEFNAELQDMQDKSTEKLKKDVESKRGQLEQWSSTAYGEVSPGFHESY